MNECARNVLTPRCCNRGPTVTNRGGAVRTAQYTEHERIMPLPSFSKAAVVRQFGQPIAIEEVPVPREIEPGAILTRIELCSICGTDVHLWQGSLASKVDLPVILGHEMVGRI